MHDVAFEQRQKYEILSSKCGGADDVWYIMCHSKSMHEIIYAENNIPLHF